MWIAVHYFISQFIEKGRLNEVFTISKEAWKYLQ